MQGSKRAWLVATVLVLAGAVWLLSGFPGEEEGDGQIARPLEEEPTLRVYMTETDEIQEMPIEEYLKGVVAGEMRPEWPEDAYAAQAILARSFTMDHLSRLGTREAEGEDISTDPEEAQAYNADNITPVIERAVESTRGEVMTYNDRFVRAWFHAYSGGVTATAEEGLGFEDADFPYIRSVELEENTVVPDEYKEWTAEFPLDEVQQKLAQANVDVGTIQDLRIAKKGNSGRVTQVEVIGQDGNETIGGPDFRLAIGPGEDGLKSTLIRSWDVEEGKLIVEGTGFGHGVGLSQWDALQMAQDGKSPEEIVNAFFDKIEIKKLWD